MRRVASLSFLLVFLVACSSGVTPPSTDPGVQPAGRIEVTPGSFLLTEAGASFALSAIVYDASGNPVTSEVSWHSSDEGVVSVGPSGIATASVSVGSAQVTARADGLESQPVLAIVATPAPGVILISDDMVVSGVDPVDASLPYATGWQYRLGLQNVTLSPGQLVLGTGETPIAGRVVSLEPSDRGVDAVIELVALPDLFSALRLDATIPLVEDTFAPSGAEANPHSPLLTPAATFSKGIFECETSSSVPELDLPEPTRNITPELALDVQYELGVGLHRLAVVGNVKADFGYKPMFKAKFEGSITCEAVLKTVTVPFNGWFAYFVGVQVPVGIGLTLDGKLEIAEVGFDVSATATAQAELGMNCTPATGACNGVQVFNTDPDFEFEFIAPDPDEQFKVELGAHGYVFAKPSVGSAFSSATQFEFLAADAGVKQSLNLATTTAQVNDPEYASTFELTAPLKVEAGKSLTDAINKLQDLLGIDLSLNLALVDENPKRAESPKGTFTITPTTVEPGNDAELGETATFTIELDPVTYLGFESVEKVEIFWKIENSDGTFTLNPGRPACKEIAGGGGKTTFTCETDFLEEHAGLQTFYAFAHAKLFGAPLPIPVEIASDAKATVDVGGCPYDNSITYVGSDADAEALRGATKINGNLVLMQDVGATLTTLEPLSELRCIGGYLDISSTFPLVDLSGLDNVTQIGFGIRASHNASLTSLQGLEGVSAFPGFAPGVGVYLWDLQALSDISALSNVVTSLPYYENSPNGPHIVVAHVPNLQSLAGLGGLTGVLAQLQLIALPMLDDASALAGITRVTHKLYLQNVPALTSLPTAFTGSEPNLRIAISYWASKLSAISGLSEIEHLDLRFNSSLSLEALAGLNLTYSDMGGIISSNCCLTDSEAMQWANGVGTSLYGDWSISGNSK